MGFMTNTTIIKLILSDEAKVRLSALALRDDSELDLDNCPEVTDWSGAVCGKFKFNKHHEQKEQLALNAISCLDDDVIQILVVHNNELDAKRINGVIRAMFAIE